VEPVEAEEWLADAGLLEVHPTRAGKNVRDLLRGGELQGHQVNRRWTIERLDVGDPESPQYHYEVERPHAWVVRAGQKAKFFERFREEGVIGIGYPPSGDLTGMSADEIADHIEGVFPGEPEGKTRLLTSQFQAFALGIQPGDLVLTPTDQHGLVLVGRVSGPYEYLENPLVGNFMHYHRVNWLDTVDRTSLPPGTQKSLGSRMTVFWAGAYDELREQFPLEERASGAAYKAWETRRANIADSGRNPTTVRSWIFQGNPAVWDIRRAVHDFAATDFSVLRYKDEIKAGHTAFLWESGPKGGVVGVAELLEDPVERPHTHDQYTIAESHVLQGVHPRADIRVLKALDTPISRDEIRTHPGLEDLAILRFAQGTNFPVTPDEAQILHEMVDRRNPKTARDPLAPPKWTNAWWVNQGATFREESEGGYVWAPNSAKNGAAPKGHWQALTGMQVGDLIFSYAGGTIRALSRVTQPAEVTDRPSELPLTEWEGQGWKVGTDYFHLDDPILLNDIPQEWRIAEKGPFDVNGAVKQQYANHLSENFVNLLIQRFGDRFRNSGPASTDNEKEATMPPSTLLELIQRRKNVVFYGPPGTGKTYEALQLAENWATTHGADSVRKVTFHPSYGYEDFVQGFRPKKDQPGEFALQPGILLRICDDARKDPDADFLLLIDEINRGDVARVFGELITYIEADKRGIPFDLAQDETAQYEIPPNLHFLGTMNTADKSVSLLDVALRRRFAFVEYRADARAFSRIAGWRASVEDLDLGDLLDTLNQRLLDEGVEVDRAIGHALLSIPTGAADPAAALKERLEYDIAPLVAEYSYLDRGRIARILPGLVDSHGRFRSDLSNDELIARLKALLAGPTNTPALSAPELGAEFEAEARETELEQ